MAYSEKARTLFAGEIEAIKQKGLFKEKRYICSPQDAEIDCFDSSGKRAGALYFYSGGGRLPQNQDTVNGIYLYYRMTRFADLMSLLQNEKPLYLNLNTDNKVGYISTSNEPVGEHE